MSSVQNPYTPPQPGSLPPIVANVVIDDASMSVEYEIEFDDLLAANLYFHQSSHAIRHKMRLARYLFFVLTGLLALLTLLDSHYRIAWVVGCGLSLAVALFWPAIYRWLIKRQVTSLYREGTSLNLVGLRRMTLTREFVIFASPILQSTVRWVGVESVIAENDMLYMKIASFSAFIVPLRAFANATQFDQFANAARGYHSAASGRAV